jgi:hypothetical protein
MRSYSLLWNAKLVSLTTEQFPADHCVGQNVRNAVPNVDMVCMHGTKEPGLIIDLRQQNNQNTLVLKPSFDLEGFDLMTIAESMQKQSICIEQ